MLRNYNVVLLHCSTFCVNNLGFILKLFLSVLASKQAYRPPSARGKEINFKLHDDEDVPTLVSETACELLCC